MNDSSKFEITGAITQKYVAPSGKVAFFKVETKINGFRTIHELKTFDVNVCRQISTAGMGEMVHVRGELGSEQLKNKAKEPVEIDGRKLYVTILKVTSISSVGEKVQANADPIEDDQVPF